MDEQTTKNTPDQAANSAANTAPDATISIDDLQQRLRQLEQESASYKDQYLRSAAEMKNYKRRIEQERGDLIRNAGAGVLMKLLPILDDLDLAMAHAPANIEATSWFNGVKLVYTKLQTVLEGEGVKPIEALGATFDPNVHEAVMHEVASPEMAGKVTAELRRGYTLHDRVIRPSLVKVGEAI